MFDVTTLEQALAESITPRRFNLILLGTFAAAAVMLALIGLRRHRLHRHVADTRNRCADRPWGVSNVALQSINHVQLWLHTGTGPD